MLVSGTTLSQSSFGQYTSVLSSVGRYVCTKLSQRSLVRKMPEQLIPLQATRSPTSSCVALMASRRLSRRTRKMKCFKDDNNGQEILISHQNNGPYAPTEACLSKKSF